MTGLRTIFSFLTFFVALTFLASLATATEYQDCGSEGTVLSVEVTDCYIPPCVVARPNNYSIGITFIAPKSAETLDTEIIAIVGGTEQVPWPAPNACGLLGDLGCPIEEGVTYPFLMTMQVLPEYPEISVLVQVQLVDEDEVKHACVVVPITVI